MLYEIIMLSFWLLASVSVAALFFCNVEMAPVVARRLAKGARFDGLKKEKKLVRFW